METDKVQRDKRILTSAEYRQLDGSTLVVPNDGVPTQVANPGRATIRTAMAALVGLVLILNPVLTIVIDFLHGLEPQFTVPPVIYAVLNGTILLVTAVIAAITRILAVPGVNEWIKRFLPWLAAIPLVDTNRQ